MPQLNNTYEMETDNLVFILKKPEHETGEMHPIIEIFGYYKKANPKKIYVFSKDLYMDWIKKDFKEEINNKKLDLISANKYILQNVLEVVYNKIKTKIENNLNNYKVYSWHNPGYWELDRKLEDKINAKYLKIYLDEALSSEVIKFRVDSYHGAVTEYDLFQDKILKIYDPETKKRKSTLSVYVGIEENNYLVAEAYQQGVAPKVVCKMKELIDWFKDKKSVRLILNDGTEYKVNDEPKINSLIAYDEENNQYLIRDSWDFNPKIGTPLSFSKVKGFKYGNSLFELNEEDFKIPNF